MPKKKTQPKPSTFSKKGKSDQKSNKPRSTGSKNIKKVRGEKQPIKDIAVKDAGDDADIKQNGAPLERFVGRGKVEPQPIVQEMEASYLDYAMSVIVSRALPDVRDGLKPVHRRILYAMWDIGLKASARFRKSATVVGEVLGKYHPHGDQAVYDSLVRMAQDFAMRQPLVNGQGNFGSMDGDSPAAMRYTEAKLAKVAEEMLYDIDKQTVDFLPNYDGSHQEPRVLPAKLPQLLLNGTVGIAVGMATSIPPHNLSELVDGIVHQIGHPQATIDELVEFVKGPDFPTGGTIYDIKQIQQAYSAGKGSVVIRAQTEIVEGKGGAFKILVTEIPYQVNKALLLEKIAGLVRDKKIEGIRDLRDESSKGEVRVVIDLRKEAYPKKILNQLFRHTNLQTTFHVNMLALVDGIEPRVLNLKIVFEEFIKHRQEVVRRRSQFDLDRAKERAHILEGLVLCLNKIDAVIKTIKAAKTRDDAKTALQKKFKLSEPQANAILDMKLSQLASLERLKIETELKEKRKIIKDLSSILKDEKRILAIIKDELLEIKEKYGSERRTKVVKGALGEFSQEDLIPDEATIVMMTRDGYIKRLPPETFKTQSRGGKGVIGLSTKEEDMVEQFFSTTTHKDLLFFTNLGRVFQLKAYEVPVSSRIAKGQAIVNFLQLSPQEQVSTVLSLKDIEICKFLVMITKKGIIKKVSLEQLKNVRRSGLNAIKLKPGDTLEWVKPSTGADEVMITSAAGQAIHFKEKDLRPMGRSASGVRGIRLKKEDEVVGMSAINQELAKNGKALVVTEHGFGKLTAVSAYRLQTRGGTGIKTAKVTEKTGPVISTRVLNPDKLPATIKGDLVIISQKGQVIRLPLKSVPILGRDTQGVRLMRFKEPGDKAASVALV